MCCIGDGIGAYQEVAGEMPEIFGQSTAFAIPEYDTDVVTRRKNSFLSDARGLQKSIQEQSSISHFKVRISYCSVHVIIGDQ